MMNFRKLLGALAIFLTYSQFAIGQDAHCGNVKAQEKILAQHPELVKSIQQLDAAMNNLDLSKLEKNKRGDYIIPLVYHVLHNYGSENVSDAQIRSDVKALNENYNKKNADTIDVIPVFKPLIANVGYEFRLANKDPEGNCTNGIDRINTYKTYFANDQSKLNQWNRSHYLNIWVAHTLENPTAAAYAFKPATAQFLFYYDGVMAWNTYVGSMGTSSPYNSKTTTHEIGHCLNLDHPWGGTNEPTVACGDDGVQDTPETKGHDNCNVLYDSTCNPPVIENVQNYMDYSYCDRMFTPGQKDRMTAALLSATAQRSSLISPATLVFAGLDGPKQDCPPKADFNVNRQFVCKGSNLTFTDKSYNDTTMTALSWDFTASGTPTTSTSLVPVSASFSTVGWKSIGLQATSNGGSGTVVKNDYIYVADPLGKNVTGQINSFEDETAFNTNWANFNYYHNNFKWEYYPWGGYSGTKCIRYHGFDDRVFPQSTVGSAKGDIDELITEAYDLSGLTQGSAYLNFLLSGATRASINADIDDSLVIVYSVNCGTTWTSLVKLSKTTLINNGTIATEFNVNPNMVWMAKSYALPQAALTSSTFFKLRYRPGDQSNNVYLDNFEINSTPVSVKDISAVGFDFEIVPNPANSFSNIQINTSANAKVSVLITDLLGAKISSFTQEVNSSKINSIEIPANVFNHKGIYFVNLDINGKKATKKLVIQ